MKSTFTYLLINFIIISGPIALTFAPTVNYYLKLKYVFYAILIVSPVFITWDIIATCYNNWGFNEHYITGFTIFSLPLEEISFFITTPYSCIFIYECIEYYLKDKRILFKKTYYLLSFIFIAGSFIYRSQTYTCIVLACCALFFIMARFFYPGVLGSRNYWLYIGITFIPFFVVNYILTALPVVIYNSSTIWGFRVLTIPLEDFFYSYSMLSLYLLCYIIVRKKAI
jgi:lycopene cyclase domain-containing protein